MNIEFDNKIFEHFKNIISESIEYANNCVEKIQVIYIYISFEWVIYFDVFYTINNKVFQRHKLNTIIKEIDVSVPKQEILLDYCNSELSKVKDLFIKDEREVPNQIKITYVPNTGKFESKFSYDKYHNDELFIGDDEVTNQWFEELQNNIK